MPGSSRRTCYSPEASSGCAVSSRLNCAAGAGEGEVVMLTAERSDTEVSILPPMYAESAL